MESNGVEGVAWQADWRSVCVLPADEPLVGGFLRDEL